MGLNQRLLPENAITFCVSCKIKLAEGEVSVLHETFKNEKYIEILSGMAFDLCALIEEKLWLLLKSLNLLTFHSFFPLRNIT